MNQRQAEIELKKIEKIARRIVQKKSSQTCGTYTQCWTYALLKAREEYNGINK